jgi:hypothetical protein
MNHDEYRKAVKTILDQGHNLFELINSAMDQLGSEGVNSAEWRELHLMMEGVSIVTSAAHSARWPAPSALTNDTLTDIPMVCTVCRKPAEPIREHDGQWQHYDFDDAVRCPAAGNPVIVMVAAGNESVPRA